MKHLSLLIILLAIVGPLQSQNFLSYESLDAYSKAISDYQLEADHLTYTEEGKKYELSFPATNFSMAFHNQLATAAVYRKTDGKDMLYLTTGIDLSKVKGITWDQLGNEVVCIKLQFVSGATVNTLVTEDDKVIAKLVRESVTLFCKDDRLGHFASKLYDACLDMQKAKGMITATEAAAQRRDLGMDPAAFIKKYPASIYRMAAEQLIKRKQEDRIAAANRVAAFIDSVGNIYHLRMGMSEASFAQQNPELTAWFFKKKYRSVAYNGAEISYSLSKKQEKDISSPVGMVSFKNDKLTFVYLYYQDFSNPSDRTAAYQQLVKQVKARVPESALVVDANSVTVRHLTEGSSLTVSIPQDMHGNLYPIIIHLYKSDR